MQIFVDNELIETDFAESATTVEAAVQHIQSKLDQLGMMVVGIRCDGETIPPDAMTKTLAAKVNDFERLEVTTGTAAELVGDAMDQSATCLAETETACGEVVDLLKKGDTTEAVETLGECLRLWQQIHDAVAKSIEMLGIDPENAVIGETPLLDVVRKPKAALVAVRDALRAQDYVLLADILEYEFSDVIEAWRALIERLQQELTTPKDVEAD